MGVRSRNRRVSILSVSKKNFRNIERIVRSMTAERLAAASLELESTGKTTDDGVKEILRSLSLYGHRQPMSREGRLTMRRKIQSNIVGQGVPAIWFTLNPNDITNPVKLRLAAYLTHDPQEAEAFLEGLENAYKRTRLAISDPMSSAVFFHREMALFFETYVNVGGESVFGRISHYFAAVETNERGALHVHGLLWLHGNAHLGSVLADVKGEDEAACKERVIGYVDSVFTEDLDAEAFCALQAERSVVADISSKLENIDQFSSAFEEEANFCAGATQIHTHSATCVKYSLGKQRQKGSMCRFKAPWKLVEKTCFTDEGILKIRRTHPMVNRWNKAIAVGLRHNHDISFIATQQKTMALIYYVTNYSTKVEDPIWKRAVTAAELLPSMSGDNAATEGEGVGGSGGMIERANENRTRQFLMKVANRVFTERPLSQVEVVAHLLGYPSEFSNSSAWAYLNTSVLYWHIFRRLFVPWEAFLCEERGDMNNIWTRAREALSPRISCLVENVQLLRRSAEDAKRDAKQWAASSADDDGTAVHFEEGGPAEATGEAPGDRGLDRVDDNDTAARPVPALGAQLGGRT
ncbi:hypothetical protein Purlil1_14261 [Purpureocillium lilacinum]|uniref:Helitron helicase-like domain-containing protein n=1 Tax=Purpureocillium lilacinum TaxID=33203 RepID=A0ABR0BBU0_PURLI|nr:hypothetical protein Purlil1_14261 [Purpureocillium lilacinum]